MGAVADQDVASRFELSHLRLVDPPRAAGISNQREQLDPAASGVGAGLAILATVLTVAPLPVDRDELSAPRCFFEEAP
jgi:hypothetical protein